MTWKAQQIKGSRILYLSETARQMRVVAVAFDVFRSQIADVFAPTVNELLRIMAPFRSRLGVGYIISHRQGWKTAYQGGAR